MQHTAQKFGLQLQSLEVWTTADLDQALAVMPTGHPDALIVATDPMLFAHQARILEAVKMQRLPAIFGFRQFVAAGGLMSYGVNLPKAWYRTGFFVDRILRGARPADLPSERPMHFELVLNRKTAETLGLMFPPTLLILADEVIE
jgi:putative ABC transport system substrate-binding protein